MPPGKNNYIITDGLQWSSRNPWKFPFIVSSTLCVCCVFKNMTHHLNVSIDQASNKKIILLSEALMVNMGKGVCYESKRNAKQSPENTLAAIWMIRPGTIGQP